MIEWVVAGLGNPGDRYVSTRHNVGFMAVELAMLQVGSVWTMNNRFQAALADYQNACFVRPQTYMNLSGISVGEVARFYKVPFKNIIVVHDDLDLPFGVVKVHFNKGPKMHNGIISVSQSLGTPDYWRIRIGVDDRTPEERSMWPGQKYVLMPLSESEQQKLQIGLHTAVQRIWETIEGNLVQ